MFSPVCCSVTHDGNFEGSFSSRLPTACLHQQVKAFKGISIPSRPVPLIPNCAKIVQNVLFWNLIKIILWISYRKKAYFALILHIRFNCVHASLLAYSLSFLHPEVSVGCIPSHSLVCRSYSTLSYLPVLQKSKAVWVLISFSYIFC